MKFLLHHPLLMSPLVKQHREVQGLAESFELLIERKEVANAYTELNDQEGGCIPPHQKD